MIEHFVVQFCEENGFRPKQIDGGVIERLRNYDWPGNVRELKNVIERAVIMSDGVVTLDDLPPFLNISVKPVFDTCQHQHKTLREFKEAMEREFISMRLDQNEWNISRTATALGIERTNLHKKIKAYGLQRSNA
jgi:two-component system nitrogen regulation response regulator NtrX